MITTPFAPARVVGCDLSEAERVMRGHAVTAFPASCTARGVRLVRREQIRALAGHVHVR